MKAINAFFPSGWVGLGLLLLRLSVASSLLMLAAALAGFSYLAQFVGVLLAIGLLAGLQTRLLSGATLLASVFGLVAGGAPLGLVILHGLTAIALAMTGPGAFSADARLFGRQTITLPDRDDSKV